MGCKYSKKPCGCPVTTFTGKDKDFGVLEGVCDKCRKSKKKGK